MRELGIEIPDERTREDLAPGGGCRRASRRSTGCSRARRRWSRTIATEIDERPTGDADTDRLLEEIRDEEQQHTVALAQLRAGEVPAIERGPAEDGPQVRLDADPRPRALAPRLRRLDLGRDLRRQRRPRRRLRAGRRLLGRDRRLAPRAHRRAVRGDRLGALDGDRRLPRRALGRRGRGGEPRPRARGGRSPTPRRRRRSSRSSTSSRGSRPRRRTWSSSASPRIPRSCSPRSRSRSSAAPTPSAATPSRRRSPAGISTAVGAMVPVIPFFFLCGTAGVIVAASVSLVAHFAVGAAKSLFTLRSAWSAGLEMTARRRDRRRRDLPARPRHRHLSENSAAPRPTNSTRRPAARASAARGRCARRVVRAL